MSERLNPYFDLNEKAFWRSGVGARHFADLENLWDPIALTKNDKIATAGSCFSQALGQNLKKRGARFMDMEPAPPFFETEAEARKWGYGVFSCRYGNIYTSRQLLQLFKEVHGERDPVEKVWEKDGRFFDALRPGIDQAGQETAEDVVKLRVLHLSAVKKMFAEMMGGDINLTSTEGKGTTFTVTIPKIVKDKKEDTIDLITTSDPENPYTILVIDDDDNAQDMMKKFLEKKNISIIQAKSGEEGLKLAAEHLPDAITLDVMMPEMDGWEVLAALQSNEEIKHIPVIMLTMADEPDIGFSLGATDYLTKPVNWNQLSDILKKHQIKIDSESIMIVEDDEVTRDMLRKSLESNNFKVRSAVNGKEALSKIEKAKPGLIILDLMMPEMDGFEFSEKLRENKNWLDIPVVVITAKDLTKEDHNRLKGNVETIMQKGSYTKKELLNEVGERIKKLQTQG